MSIRFFMLGLLLTVLVGCGKNPKPKQVTFATNPISPVRKLISESTPEQFFDLRMRYLLSDQFPNGKLPYEEINAEYLRVSEIVVARRGKAFDVYLRPNYHPQLGPTVVASSGENEKGPFISLYIPSFMDTYRSLQRHATEFDFETVFANHVIVAYMHEVHHLEDGELNGNGISVEREGRVWAVTAEKVLVPLVEKYRAPILADEGAVYKAWRESNRNPMSQVWRDFMAKKHAMTISKPVE